MSGTRSTSRSNPDRRPVLFFGGIRTQFESRAIGTGMLVVGMIVLIATETVMLTFPMR